MFLSLYAYPILSMDGLDQNVQHHLALYMKTPSWKNLPDAITNKGKLPGKEVVQWYVSAPEGKLKKPARELKG